MTVMPAMLTFERSFTPARSSTFGPTTQNGPISTSSASLAPSDTRAIGSILATSGVRDHRAEFGFSHELTTDLRFAAVPPHVLAPRGAVHVVLEHIAWKHRLSELGFIDGEEIDDV